MKKLVLYIVTLMLGVNLYADGIMLPDQQNYPQQFVKNLFTEITVNIHGNIAETIVVQEFYNDYDQEIEATWNFPMPLDARATGLFYWFNDTCYEAELKVAQQVTNPGTGEGGIAALVNDYIGRNGIRFEFGYIGPHCIQRIEFHYIQIIDYSRGTYSYNYPLNTSDFIENYINYLNVKVNTESSAEITGWDFPGYMDNVSVLNSQPNQLSIEMHKDKAYLANDLSFNYNVSQENLMLDHYSNYCDTMDSHFVSVVRPPAYEIPERVYYKRITFLIGNSSSMNGYKIQQSISAVSEALDSLKIGERFNIIFYNGTVTSFNSAFVAPTTENIAAARDFMENITVSGGSNLNYALYYSLDQYTNTAYQNCILVFSDGHSSIDPNEIASYNVNNTAICFVALDDNIDRERLEMTSSLNYGFVSYADVGDNLKENIMSAFYRINLPIIKDTQIDFNKPDVNRVYHQPLPSVYAGGSFFVAGRYSVPESNFVDLTGDGVLGAQDFNFPVTYSTDTSNDYFARLIWAKIVMDELEWKIMIYGEDPILKDSLIDLSLGYKIKCRYTAYYQMEEHSEYEPTGISNLTQKSQSDLIVLYPNPFTDVLKLSVDLNDFKRGSSLILKIFNENGLLVKVIDLSKYVGTIAELEIEMQNLASGIYYISLQNGNQTVQTVRGMHL